MSLTVDKVLPAFLGACLWAWFNGAETGASSQLWPRVIGIIYPRRVLVFMVHALIVKSYGGGSRRKSLPSSGRMYAAFSFTEWYMVKKKTLRRRSEDSLGAVRLQAIQIRFRRKKKKKKNRDATAVLCFPLSRGVDD